LRNTGNERPCIILLDLNMPLMNGIEFLKEFKQDSDLKKIPVVVLTTSKEEEDKINSYNLGIAGYMIKPVDYIEFVEVVRTIDLYWTLSELPE
jgi:DNA-binding response OmpR family regulator